MKATHQNAPLKVGVRNGKLVISIGVETLAWASQTINGGPLDIKVRKGQYETFAKDVAREITKEDEVGDTPLAVFLDAMMVKASEEGSPALVYPK